MDGITAVIFMILAIIFIILYIKELKKEDSLCKKINLFLDKGTAIPLSTKDDRFSYLEGLICEMQNEILKERHNRIRDRKETTEFVSDISHQLKTPLAGLKLYIEMEHNEKPTPATQKEMILIEKTENLIADILNLEKLTSPMTEFDFADCETENIITDILSGFRAMYPNKNFTLTGSGKIRADKKYLSEAIGNIIKNAAEHTETDGNIDIKIEDSENSVSVFIEDDGGGVPEKELPELFRRFHKTKNASAMSAGVGLAVTKAIVEKHHGSVFAENGSQGLKIIICLPKLEDLNIKKM